MSDRKQNIMWSYIIICGIAVVLMFGIIGKIIYIQTKERDEWMKEAAKQKKTDVEVAPSRGNIYACDGRLMASSLPTYNIYMDPCTEWLMKDSSKLFYKYIDTLSISLHKVLPDHPISHYKNIITSGHNTGKRNIKLHPTAITYQQMQEVKKIEPFCFGANQGGLKWEEQKKRKQQFGSLARRTLGSTYANTDTTKGTIEGNGSSGLELYYNDLLKGKPGRSVRQRVTNRDEYEIVQPAVNGCDIYTTLDIDLLDITEYALRKQLAYSEASWGCAVLMETQTGDIKAISNLKRDQNKPGFYYEGENYAAQAFEPGSTFKTLSLMAALDDNLIKLTDTINTNNGEWVYKDKNKKIKDTHVYPKVTAKKALTVSSNVALAKIITKGYKDNANKYVAKLQDMGLTTHIDIAIPGAHSVNISVPNDKETMAHMAFGYSVEVPPIYMLTYYNAIANNGKMVEPKLVTEIRQGVEVVKHYDTNILKNQICKSSTLTAIRECLESVVWDPNGTANDAQSDTVHIAGKTGTAKIISRGEYINAYRVTFCGFFPYDNPKYTCICVIERPKRGGAGSLCGKVVKEIAEHTMAIKGTIDIDSIQSSEFIKPKVKAGNRLATRKVSRHIDVPISGLCNDSTDWVTVNSDLESTNIEVKPYFVPNVIGMGAKDAVYAIEQTGMRVKLNGKGQVVQQSIKGGQPAQIGGTVYIELR